MTCLTKLLDGLAKFAMSQPKPADVIPIRPIETVAPVAIKPPPSRVLMIDVSHYEPIPDYKKLVLNGVRAVYVKVSEYHVDTLFKDHLHAAQAVGLPCGGYHFFHGSVDGHKQAELYLNAIHDVKLNLRHCLDWESGSADKMSSSHQQVEADKWLGDVEKSSGHTPIIYGGESFLRELNLPVKYARYGLWLAHYGVSESNLKFPFPWHDFVAWQYTDAAHLSGLVGSHTVDASYAVLKDLLI